ncbi:hypothetical protein B0H12DRAFT_149474 [Mycena haematopus]|nr:hypothetical protein B0H12DRAFT_149474 [Mycena haematopus]
MLWKARLCKRNTTPNFAVSVTALRSAASGAQRTLVHMQSDINTYHLHRLLFSSRRFSLRWLPAPARNPGSHLLGNPVVAQVKAGATIRNGKSQKCTPSQNHHGRLSKATENLGTRSGILFGVRTR